MSDEEKPNPDADGGGNGQPPDKQPENGAPKQERTFTQSELDAIIDDRLKRERQKYSDYDELKSAAEKWQAEQDKRKSAEEKLQEQLAMAQRERDEAQARANDTLIRSAFVMEATRLGAAHPGDAYALADISEVTIDDDGKVEGVEEQVKALVENGRLPTAQTKPDAPKLDGGAGSKKRKSGGEKVEIDEERIKAKYGI